jgi:two-component system phosphate regulon sensor histidine kinase PhoR
MFSELLQSGRVDTPEKREQYLRIIVQESERLSALIENVLDFARAERGQAAYELTLARPGEVVTRAVEACRVRAQREGVTLEIEVAHDLPPIRLDERAVEIAVINLVDNALKYASDGKRVQVAVRAAGDHVEVRVSDAGPGIAPEDRKRIFERFVRGRHGRQVRGSGIGLALVKHIAQAHGGRAWMEPAAPSGACFVFSLASGEPGPLRDEDGIRQQAARRHDLAREP